LLPKPFDQRLLGFDLLEYVVARCQFDSALLFGCFLLEAAGAAFTRVVFLPAIIFLLLLGLCLSVDG
jgi:hypothetical protein